MSKPIYGRILLKLSGEILAGDRGFGVDPSKANLLAQEIKSVADLGLEIGVVIDCNLTVNTVSPSLAYKIRGLII